MCYKFPTCAIPVSYTHLDVYKRQEYYGYSGDRVKGLIFCSRIDESVELSKKFNALGYRTVALNGDATEEERSEAFERLAMNEADATEEVQPLDYIISVDILNEGVDIVEVLSLIHISLYKERKAGQSSELFLN